MIEVLKFIFSSFWVWLGTLILLSTITSAVVSIAHLLMGKK